MSCFLLYHPRTRPSGLAVAGALGVRSGYNTRRRAPASVMIRWGSQRVVDEPPLVLNSVPALVCAADKLKAFEAMSEAGVRVPPFTAERLVWSQALPLIGRTRRGRGGEGITIYREGDELGEHELYVKFIDAAREYRLHVVGDDVIRAQYKVQVEGVESGPIRNYKHGWRFRGVGRLRLNRDRNELAIAAVAALGLDFGAVDMLIDQEGRAFVLEVNTAPACSPMTAAAYADAFRRWLI